MIGYHDQMSVSTTHSTDVGISVEASSAPFGIGVTFTASASYGSSVINEELTTFCYGFDIEEGDPGYIAIANA
ncbi:hypothetical protein BGZ54_008458 [Gamsiella multidivaricata]|nr:hypothetical protein BGZ54_008458 [Gamsiella multidivaricata]